MGSKASPRINAIPSIGDLFFCLILCLLFFPGTSGLLGDGDTGYHIRAGEYIIRTFSVPKTDIFSFHTPALPWTAHEWLSEVIMAAVHQRFGLTGVVAFFAVLLAGTTSLLFKMLRSHGSDILLASAITVLAFSSAQIHWLARPHVFSFLLMIIWHHLLDEWHRDRGNRLYLLPPLMLLWVNLHGGFLGGFILLGAFLMGNVWRWFRAPVAARTPHGGKLRQLSLTIGACAVMSLVNPQGYRILLFPFKLVTDSFIMDHVNEFLSPNFHEPLIFKYLLLLLISIFAVSKKGVEATELLLILIFTNMALYSARYIPLFALIMAPILTRHSGQTREGTPGRVAACFRERSDNIDRIDARATGYIWPAAAVLVVAIATVSGSVHHWFDAKTKAVAAVEFLMKERIPGNMFNNDEFGDYLIYRGYPAYRVFFDGRSDMYGAPMLREYYKVTNFEDNWEGILEKYRITWIFYDTSSNFARYLVKDGNWRLIYSDQVASIFVRNLPQYRYLIDKYPSVKLAPPHPQ